MWLSTKSSSLSVLLHRCCLHTPLVMIILKLGAMCLRSRRLALAQAFLSHLEKHRLWSRRANTHTHTHCVHVCELIRNRDDSMPKTRWWCSEHRRPIYLPSVIFGTHTYTHAVSLSSTQVYNQISILLFALNPSGSYVVFNTNRLVITRPLSSFVHLSESCAHLFFLYEFCFKIKRTHTHTNLWASVSVSTLSKRMSKIASSGGQTALLTQSHR